MSYDLKAGGIVLSDVKHDEFGLARRIAVDQVIVRSRNPLRFVRGETIYSPPLGGTTLPAIGGVTVVEPPPETGEQIALGWRAPIPGAMINPSPMFRVYKTLFALTSKYQSTFKLFDKTPNECSLEIGQRHLFSGYGKNPPHEPGAVLDAARIFPLISFSLPPVKDKSKPHPAYIRVDYRIDLALDNIEESALGRAPVTGGDTQNKAAIFRDIENAPAIWDVVSRAVPIFTALPFGSPLDTLFAAYEKPVKFEIVSRGLNEGDPSGSPSAWSKLDTWDNVHVWPAKRGSGSNAVSTPGAFHALHCHWRWGAVAGNTALPPPTRTLLPGAGGAQFQGLGWTTSAGGPLIDAAIPRQNITFAITGATSRSVFEVPFGAAEPRAPTKISSGADLTLWLSFEVFRDGAELDRPWGGTLFVNGMYFGHNKDATPLELQIAGAHAEGWRPTPKQEWQRRAR